MNVVDKQLKIANSCLKRGLITRQYILFETIRIYKLLIAAGYCFHVDFRNIEVRAFESNEEHVVLGQANLAGQIWINEIYIGTKCINSLRAVILHEFAHLYVGLEAEHNSVFENALQEMLKLFGWTLGFETEEERLLLQ